MPNLGTDLKVVALQKIADNSSQLLKAVSTTQSATLIKDELVQLRKVVTALVEAETHSRDKLIGILERIAAALERAPAP